MKPAKAKQIKLVCGLAAATLAAALLFGCHPAGFNWSSFTFRPGTQQGQAMDDRAVAHFLSQIRVRPGNAEAHCNLASYYQERGLYREAIAEYNKAILIDPTDIRAHNGKGICLDQTGEHDGAVASFKRALALDATQEYLWNNLCYSYYLKGNYQEAVAACEQAVSINGRNIRIRNNLALVLAMSGRYDRAFTEFTAAGGGDKSYAHLKLAAVYYDKAMFAKAFEHYNAAQALNPESTVARDGLAAAREMIKIADAAKIHDDAEKNAAEKAGTLTAQSAVVPADATKVTPREAAEEFAYAGKLYDQGAFEKAARHFERSLALEPRLKSADRGLAAAAALEKIAAAPSTKRMGKAGSSQSDYRSAAAVIPQRAGIEITNGNGKRHMARDIGKYLRKSGFNVVSLSNARHFKHESGSIIYEKDYKSVAEAIAAGIPQLTDMQEVEKLPRSDVKVRVLLGKDLLTMRDRYRN